LKKDNKGRFLYHAQGMALGGFLTAPVDEFIETQAAVSLPITGGYGRADSKDYRFRDFVSLREAHTYVTGKKKTPLIPTQDESAATYETLVTCVVEGLNILDVVTADRIVARLVSKGSGDVHKSPEISTIGSHFVNLRIKGHEVKVDFPSEDTKTLDTNTRTFVSKSILQNTPHGFQRDGDVDSLYIPHFGSIYLGELIVSPESRRLTMLRVELGCSADGSVAVGTVEGDGHQTT
jgi:hypothetical protein